jgi:hypothetical protein
VAAGRAYYALFLEARDALIRWGIALPPHTTLHADVRLRFLYARDADLKNIGQVLDSLGQLRSYADYRLSPPGKFTRSTHAAAAVSRAERALVLLDAIAADTARSQAAVADIRSRWP